MPRIRGLGFSYYLKGKAIPAFAGVDADIPEGSICAIVGPSGCGKTSLIRVLAGLERPGSGGIEWGPSRDSFRRPRAAVIFQDFGLLPWKTVRRNIELPLKLAGLGRADRAEAIAPILDELGLAALAERFPARISGGQRQRVAVARALAAGPEILLMDEPFSSLDTMTRESLQDSLLEVRRRHGNTIVIVTHSIDEAARLADRVFVMGGRNPGRIVATIDRGDARTTARAETQTYVRTDTRADALADSEAAFAAELRRVVEAAHHGEALAGQDPASATGPATGSRSGTDTAPPDGSPAPNAPERHGFLRKLAGILFAGLATAAVWALLAQAVGKPFLPAPGLALDALIRNLSNGVLARQLGASARRIGLALLVAGPPAWLLGLLSGRVKIAGGILSPFVYLFHPLPKVAFLPLLMLFLGLGDASKVALMGLVIFGQFFVGARDAAKGIPPLLVDSVRSTAGAIESARADRPSDRVMPARGAVLRHVILPGTLPELFSALRVSLGTTIAVLFLSETFASSDGLGWHIMDAWSRVDYPEMYAAIMALALFGLILYLAADAAEALACRWRE